MDVDKVHSVLAVMKEQAYRANDLITHFSSFTREESIEKASNCINGLFEHAIYLLSYDLVGVDVTVKLCKESLFVLMDRLLLLQVIMNILQNAIDVLKKSCFAERKLVVSVIAFDEWGVRISI